MGRRRGEERRVGEESGEIKRGEWGEKKRR